MHYLERKAKERRQRILLIRPAALEGTWHKFLSDYHLGDVEAVSYEKLSGDNIDFEATDLAISTGSLIRVIRAPYFGKVGKVKLLPAKLTQMESETLVRVAEIEFEDGSVEIIPRANLEMILT